MSNHVVPGVYIEEVASSSVSTSPYGEIVTGFCGITQRGVVGEAVRITSWHQFIKNFAGGLDSPFFANGDLAYAVYGFFQNGGSVCYVSRIVSDDTTFAESVSADYDMTIREKGAWGNNVKVEVKASVTTLGNFDVIVSLGVNNVVEKLSNLSGDNTKSNYWITSINDNSKFLQVTDGTLKAGTVTFDNGVDSFDTITDVNTISSIKVLSATSEINTLALPKLSSVEVIAKNMIEFCDKQKFIMPILETTESSSIEDAVAYSQKFDSKAVLCYPHIQVTDPLNLVRLRSSAISGHYAGMCARIARERRLWKAPAGVEAVLKGAVSPSMQLNEEAIGTLNEAKVCSAVAKPDGSTVIWGARTLSSEDDFKYVNNVLLDNHVRKSIDAIAQKFVFEANDSETWGKLATEVQSFLNVLYQEGAFKGETPEEAYFVKCDADLNDEETVAKGELICKVGYAGKRPAEFIIFQVSHNVTI